MDLSSEGRPILRWPLDIQHLEMQGQAMALIRDPFEVSEQPAAIPEVLLPIIARFDGVRTIADIAEEGKAVGLTEEIVRQVAKLLNDLDLLDTTYTREKFERIKAEFHALPVRPLSHAGMVYSTDAEKVSAELAGFLDRVPPGAEDGVDPDNVLVLFAPHIDYQRGWRSYAKVLRLLLKLPQPDVLFLLGTTHQPGESAFVLTNKAFATPFGTLPAAAEVVNDIAERYGRKRAYASEILHRKEHSLELLLPFLGRAFCSGTAPSIVPVLVGGFHQYMVERKSPDQYEEVASFIPGLAGGIAKLRQAGKRVLIVCGIDLAHMGLHFGDSVRACPQELPQIEADDRELLKRVYAADSREVFEHISQDQDRRKVCGYPTLYTVLRALEEANIKTAGTDFGYEQAADEQSDCLVSFFSGCLSEVS